MKLYLCNAFSLNMLPPGSMRLCVAPITSVAGVRLLLTEPPGPTEHRQGTEMPTVVNAIGHKETDVLVRGQIGLELPEGDRMTVTLQKGDCAVVAQYMGPRLPEGATELPEGARIEYKLVCVGDSRPCANYAAYAKK